MMRTAHRLGARAVGQSFARAWCTPPLLLRWPNHEHPEKPSQRNAWWWASQAESDSCSLGQAEAPQPARVPEVRRRYGMEWNDEFSWMEKHGPDLQKHLGEESMYARAILSGVQPLVDVLEDEMLRRLPRQQMSVPERWGPFEYYSRQDEEQSMPCYMRRRINTNKEEVVLDCNELEGRHVRGRVGVMKISRCQGLLAYLVDDGASERYSCWVKDLRTGQTLEDDVIPEAAGIEWSPDGLSLLYTHPDPVDGRPSKVFRHVLGTASASDQLLLTEDDPAAYLDVSRTKDWAFNVLNSNTKASSEVYYLLHPEDSKLCLVLPRTHGHQYFIGESVSVCTKGLQGTLSAVSNLANELLLLTATTEHHHGRLLVLSNHDGPDYQLLSVPLDSPEHWPDISKWDVILPRREGVVLEDLDMFSSHAVVYLRAQGKPKVEVLPMGPGSDNWQPVPVSLELPDWALCLQPGLNPDGQGSHLVVSVSSPAHPAHWLQYNLLDLKRQPQLLRVDLPATDRDMCGSLGGAADGNSQRELSSYRISVPSTDGSVEVPVTLTHKSCLKADGAAPLLLEVYGAYGMSLETDFSSHKLSLLKRGWVIASAHCRGGGELGQAWHEAGRRLNKQRGVDDATAVLDWLLAEKYSSPGLVAVHGFSAGGLIAASLCLRRPNLLGGAWLQAPFVDLLTTATDPSLPMTIHEYDEWGHPADAQILQTISSVCPYHSLPQYPPPGVSAPAVLVSSATDDSRVPYWGPAKWVARYRQELGLKEGPERGPVILCCEDSGGHYGFEPDEVHATATAYAFLIAAVNRSEQGSE